jgi:hypothetical protein
MNNDNKSEIQTVEPVKPVERKPNDQAGFYFSSFLKISDPESGEVIVQTRAD